MHNRSSHIGVAAASVVLISVGVAAQTGPGPGPGPQPVCCKYTYEWPPDFQGPDGACSGNLAVVCETGSSNTSIDDPNAKLQTGTLRYAECIVYTAGQGGVFVRSDCDGPPVPGANKIGILPNGQCCWTTGTFHKHEIPLTFKVPNCVESCDDGGGTH